MFKFIQVITMTTIHQNIGVPQRLLVLPTLSTYLADGAIVTCPSVQIIRPKLVMTLTY